MRVVLNTLGAEDYGIYNVIAGVATMFGFLSNSMAAAGQRYFSFDIGRGDFEHLKKVFNLSLVICVLIDMVVLILAETVGLWFVSAKLVIPHTRMDVVRWVYQFSILSFLLSVMVTPYIATIIAHEDMNIYASVSIVETVLKLIPPFLLSFFSFDKLKLYSILLCIVSIVIAIIYQIICKRKYQECRFEFYWNKDLFKVIAGYTGWNLFGSFSLVLKTQGINILLNLFFGPLVNAARGIASSVNAAVVSFSQNFSTALRPQIIKSYAAENKTEMLKTMFYGCKSTYLLMYIFTLPLVIEMPLVLSIWLKNTPSYVILFTRFALIDALIDSISFSIMTVAQATGKIKLYQSTVGGILLLNLPVSWAILRLGAPAYSVMIVSVFLTIIVVIVRIVIVKYLVTFSLKEFLKEVIIPLGKISILSAIIPFLAYHIMDYGVRRLLIITGISIFLICILGYMFGLSNTDRSKIILLIKHKLFSV
jgi:O-antigen/teichoic acid export membrane protein